MDSLDGLEDFVREKVEKERWTHSQISEHLQQAYPGVKGFSVRSIERFCREKEIRKTARLSDQELDEAVAGAISQVFCSVCEVYQCGVVIPLNLEKSLPVWY